MIKILVDSDIPYIKGILEPYFDVRYVAGKSVTHSDIKECKALITRTRTMCNQALLADSSVEFIGTASIGCDHIDLNYCKDNSIEVTTAAGCNARAVLQWVMAVVAQFDKKRYFDPPKTTIGVIGVGNVGREVAQSFKAMGFEVLMCDPPRALAESDFEIHNTPLNHLLASSDIITIHTPLTYYGEYATHNLIDSHNISKIKQGAVLINAARGGVINQQQLKAAILEQRLAHTAIDTWESEPDIDLGLLEIVDIATPHIAGYSAQGKANATSMIVRAIARKYDIIELLAWYPSSIAQVAQTTEMSWSNIRRIVPLYYDVELDSNNLKQNPERFEFLRNNYNYRTEFL